MGITLGTGQRWCWRARRRNRGKMSQEQTWKSLVYNTNITPDQVHTFYKTWAETRLSDDIAVMITSRVIDLQHPYVSPACFPSCQEQFDHVFSNGTGARCWTAGWGKDEFSGSFQFIQHKVDVPLVPAAQCNAALKQALNQKKPGVGDRFQLTQGEVCAGTENGKDACTGDGGSPLVCQAQSGRWTVVGLVAWGIGCGSHVPGVYTNVHHYKQWINSIN